MAKKQWSEMSKQEKKSAIFGLIIIGAVLVIIIAMVSALGSNKPKRTADNTSATAATNTQQQKASSKTSQSASTTPTTSSTSSSHAQTTPAKPALRQDLAFQGDAMYCNGIYKDNGNGTTTWSYDIKQNGELITHLSANNGQIYRHDVQITNAPNYYSYTAPVAINDVAEIDGVFTLPGDSSGHPCNLSPQQQPQQSY